MAGRIYLIKSSGDRTAYLIFFNVLSIAMITMILTVATNWGGVCVDVLGVASPAVLWGEWCACGPMLLFSVLFPSNKTQITRMDITLQILFFTCLVSGFLINLPQPKWMGGVWLCVSCLTYLPFILLPYNFNDPLEYDSDELEHQETIDLVKYSHLKCQQLSLWFAGFMPLFVVTYFLALSRVLQHGHTILLFHFISLVTKGIYAVLLLDIHLDADIAEQQHHRAATNRKDFLRYLLQELLSPLNSLTLGFEIFDRNNNNLDLTQLESLSLMRGASDVMSSTLTNVLDLHRLERGQLKLAQKPFHLVAAVTNSLTTVREAALGRGVTLEHHNDDHNGHGVKELVVVGDQPRLEHVLASLLGHAVKHSPRGGVVTVYVSCSDEEEKDGQDDGEEANWRTSTAHQQPLIPSKRRRVVIAVRDEGPGMNEEQQNELFSSPTRLHLSLCCQVVRLHGGELSVKSEPGVGSVYCVSIPYRMLPVNENLISRSNCNNTLVNREVPQFLVIEELEDNRQPLRMRLQRCDLPAEAFEVLVVGAEAVHQLLRNPAKYSMLLLNNHTPSTSGLRLVHFIRACGFQNLLVVLTADAPPYEPVHVTSKDYLTAGADLVLQRPLQGDNIAMLLQLLRRHGGRSLRNRMKLSLEITTESLEWLQLPGVM
eukprot:CAMPEP_0170071948 /NCGR_PEP_ID=MMETSP0019_2-20121128/9712_1 /TAXON_ID=98059 /ORGANISM="Dinobryon sp., Strain UTEXLB2267" /LENGTH=654 /DNA_ID=CAMNT_0010280681 /DNA_START=58 /DNA_END=2022 /DNA_ORIENTATION=+